MLTVKQLNAKIAGVRKSTATMRANVQEILCNAAGHAYEHGDVTSFDLLLEATSGMNRKKIVRWIKTNGFAVVNPETAKFNVNKSARKNADFEDGHAVSMYLFTEVPAWFDNEETVAQLAKDLDVHALLAAALKRMDTMDAKEDGAKLTNKNPAATAELFNLLVERAHRLAA